MFTSNEYLIIICVLGGLALLLLALTIYAFVSRKKLDKENDTLLDELDKKEQEIKVLQQEKQYKQDDFINEIVNQVLHKLRELNAQKGRKL